MLVSIHLLYENDHPLKLSYVNSPQWALRLFVSMLYCCVVMQFKHIYLLKFALHHSHSNSYRLDQNVDYTT